MAFLSVTDMLVAKELGADIVNKTFPEDVPLPWFFVFSNAGWTPVVTPPDEAAVNAQAEAKAKAAALDAEVAAMSFEAFTAARNAGWSPGQPLPGTEDTPETPDGTDNA